MRHWLITFDYEGEEGLTIEADGDLYVLFKLKSTLTAIGAKITDWTEIVRDDPDNDLEPYEED